jgi:hypothetical protein
MNGKDQIVHAQAVATYKEFLESASEQTERGINIALANPDLFEVERWTGMGIEVGEIHIKCPAMFTEAVAMYGTEQQRAAILN